MRLAALEDAIAEVYASLFHPDPIEYRRERGLIDFQEQMGVLIQEVVGREAGGMLFPVFAGVAFSRCEMRWSPRIRHTDGMARLVLGLGTRAVDRTVTDYPVLVALEQPTLRSVQRPDEVYRYSQHDVDVIDLQESQFESQPLAGFMKRVGRAIPNMNRIFSIFPRRPDPADGRSPGTARSRRSGGDLRRSAEIGPSRASSRPCSTSSRRGSANRSMSSLHTTAMPSICSSAGLSAAARMAQRVEVPTMSATSGRSSRPTGTSRWARRRTSSTWCWSIRATTRVLEKREEMLRVARAVGAVNKALPQRRFLMMGPGRWGSRGDIKLGVPVTYADICHTSILVEIARKKGSYLPDVSFGTHFFNDLVESGINYLPLYPDDSGGGVERRLPQWLGQLPGGGRARVRRHGGRGAGHPGRRCGRRSAPAGHHGRRSRQSPGVPGGTRGLILN